MADIVMTRTEVPTLDIDPFSRDVLADPYPFFEQLREAGPVAWLSKHDCYAVGRHDEVATVMADWERFTNEGGVGMSDIRKPGAWRPSSVLIEVDPPQHTKVRGALMKIISPIVIRKWREGFEAEAKLLTERLLDGPREVDGVRDIAEAFVMKVFPDAVGSDVPRDNAVAVGDLNFNALGPNNELLQAAVKHAEPFMAWYQNAYQRSALKPGGFGQLIYQAEDEGAFAPGSGENIARSFIRGGMDTTISGIGFTLRDLAQHPEALQAVKADPGKSRAAFEETIRHESPVQVMFRTTRGEPELSGMRLRADTKVACFMGAANRDPRKWTNPAAYDLSRHTLGVHLAFGAGPHVCIGQMIARLEADCLLGALLPRLRAIELAGEPTYRLINTLRTLDRLPLRLVPA